MFEIGHGQYDKKERLPRLFTAESCSNIMARDMAKGWGDLGVKRKCKLKMSLTSRLQKKIAVLRLI